MLCQKSPSQLKSLATLNHGNKQLDNFVQSSTHFQNHRYVQELQICIDAYGKRAYVIAMELLSLFQLWSSYQGYCTKNYKWQILRRATWISYIVNIV